MKIVFLAPFGIRPKGTVIARMVPLAVELQKSGHSVIIVAPPYTNPEDSGRIEVLRGVKLVNVVLPACGKALGALPLAWRMFRAAVAEQPDIVHLFKPKGYGGLAAMLLLSLQRCGVRMPPLIVDTDDWEGKGGMNDLHAYSTLEKRSFAFQERWLSCHAAGMTVASRELQKLTVGLGAAPERILYLPNCVEDTLPGDGARVRRKVGIGPEEPVVLLYTRFFEFSQEKLHAVLTDIWRQVPAVRFLVVGKGRNNEESLLLSAGRERGFAPALVMGGWLQPDDITSYLAAADLALYPFSDTLVNRSKCPAKMTEILRAAIPVVADNVGQLAEYVKADVSGILCDPENWGEMAGQAVRLLRDREAGCVLGAAGRRYLLDNFSWDSYAAGLDKFYASIIHKRKI